MRDWYISFVANGKIRMIFIFYFFIVNTDFSICVLCHDVMIIIFNLIMKLFSVIIMLMLYIAWYASRHVKSNQNNLTYLLKRCGWVDMKISGCFENTCKRCDFVKRNKRIRAKRSFYQISMSISSMRASLSTLV